MSVLAVAFVIGLWQVVKLVYFPVADINKDEYPVTGIDVSAHNGDIKFDKVKSDSITFVYMKSSEGASFRDSKFEMNYNGARNAGLYVGAYHFFRFDMNGTLQAINFIGSVNGKQLDLPLAIDVEQHGNPEVSTDVVISRLQEMIDYLEERNFKVLIYTNVNGYNKYVEESFADYSLWICRLYYSPSEDIDWQIWQLSHTSQVSGISGDVDFNVFGGSREAFASWISR